MAEWLMATRWGESRCLAISHKPSAIPRVLLGPRTQSLLGVARFGNVIELVAEPRQAERPVAAADRGGLVDAVAPPEDVLHRQHQQIGAAGAQSLEQRIANRHTNR